MHGKPDGTKARKESGTKVFDEQSILSNQNELNDGIVWWKKPHKIMVTSITRDIVGQQFCLDESINFSDPLGTIKNNGKDVHIRKMNITVRWKVLSRNIDNPELTKCFY